ncbi:MAG: hypothetical protein ACREKN_01660 [Longimicrobiaceae bacterium]
MAESEFHVLVKKGDAEAEVESALAELAAGGTPPQESGLHKVTYVTRARQTVVMVDDRDAPLTRALRERAGWDEPGLGEVG